MKEAGSIKTKPKNFRQRQSNTGVRAAGNCKENQGECEIKFNHNEPSTLQQITNNYSSFKSSNAIRNQNTGKMIFEPILGKSSSRVSEKPQRKKSLSDYNGKKCLRLKQKAQSSVLPVSKRCSSGHLSQKSGRIREFPTTELQPSTYLAKKDLATDKSLK